MSRPQRVSKRDQNGSLTSEPDNMSQKGSGHPKPVGDRSRSARSASRGSSRNDTGPDTSTPVKTVSLIILVEFTTNCIQLRYGNSED